MPAGLGSSLSQLRKELIDPSKLFGKMAPRRWNEGADPQVVLHAELGKQTPVLGNMGNSARDDAVRWNTDE